MDPEASKAITRAPLAEGTLGTYDKAEVVEPVPPTSRKKAIAPHHVETEKYDQGKK